MIVFELTLDQIIQIHNDNIKEYGVLEGIKELGLPDYFIRVNIYWEGPATGHFFYEANMRTSVMVMLVFLDINGELDAFKRF